MARVQNKKQMNNDDRYDKSSQRDSRNSLVDHKSKPSLESKSGEFITPVQRRNHLVFTDNLREEYHSILLPLERYVPFSLKGNDLLIAAHVQNEVSS